MKGTPKVPQCGFSARAVQCIECLWCGFCLCDILANPEIRQTLPQVFRLAYLSPIICERRVDWRFGYYC